MADGRKNKAKSAEKSAKKPKSNAPKNALDPETNERYIAHSIHLAALGNTSLDYTSVDRVKERIHLYFAQCVSDAMKPNLAGMALAFGTSRTVLRDYITGQSGKTIIPDQVRKLLEMAYNMINTLNEAYMMDGIVNPVSGIFNMKNNFGYKDTSETTVVQRSAQAEGQSTEALIEKYRSAAESMLLNAGVSDAMPSETEKESKGE